MTGNWVDLTCRMLMIGILLRPNFILKDGYQQGILIKIELVLAEKDDAKPDLKIEYFREYFSKGVINELKRIYVRKK